MKAEEKRPHHISGCKVNQLFARYKTKTKTITIFNETNSMNCDTISSRQREIKDAIKSRCNGGKHYTNELGDIILDPWTTNKNEFCSFGTMEETAAKYAELCLAAGCKPSDIYTSY